MVPRLLLTIIFPTRPTALIATVKTCRFVITFIKNPKLFSLFIISFACLGKIESLRSIIWCSEKNLGQSYGVQNFSLVTLKT